MIWRSQYSQPCAFPNACMTEMVRFETLTVGQCYSFPIADVRVTASQADGTQRCTRYACVLQADLATVKRAGLLTHRV